MEFGSLSATAFMRLQQAFEYDEEGNIAATVGNVETICDLLARGVSDPKRTAQEWDEEGITAVFDAFRQLTEHWNTTRELAGNV